MLSIPERVLFALVLVGSLAYFAHRSLCLVRFLRVAKPDPENRKDNLGRGIVEALLDVVLQRKVLRKPWTGFLHLLIVWGFFVFAINTINHFAGAFLPGFHMLGDTRLARLYSAQADAFALLIIVGVVGLAVRRYVLRPPNLTPRSIESGIVFIGIGGAMVAYLLANATEIAMGHGEFAAYHFAASAVAQLFAGLGEGALNAAGHVAWWTDALFHLGLIALLVIPTKHMHLVAGPINIALMRTRPRGEMLKMDLEDEEAESFGVSKIEDYTWKQNLDLYACIECGRCQDFCPTTNTNKPLKPKELIVGLKDYLIEHGPALVKAQASGEEAEIPALIGGTVSKDTLWACTTCMACIEHCPMAIEHVDKLTDLRRYLVLTEGDAPEEANTAFRNMETAGNPWGFAPAERAKWADGLDVPIMAAKKKVDVLWWVGCSGSYDDRTKKVSKAMVAILDAAGVDYAILGEEERCNCESARRLGNEYLYQAATMEIVETLKQYEFKRILVTCPHCYNTFANDYPAFEGVYEVVHHSEFIAELLSNGKLKPSGQQGKRVVYHDSCYIGRYNGVYDAPRQALEAAGASLVPATRERECGFCCGAGGGRMWLEESLGDPINANRAQELLATGADEIAAACPFCITMLGDAIKNEGDGAAPLKDIAEIVAEAIAP